MNGASRTLNNREHNASPPEGFTEAMAIISPFAKAAGWAGILAALAPLWLPGGALCAAPTTNVILLIADDLGRDSLGIYNSNAMASIPPTPNLNSMAAGGIRFERFYAMPVCSPTRACIMTGRYGFRHGVLEAIAGSSTVLAPNEFTLPEALLASGVVGSRLKQVGKWHLGSGLDVPNTIGGWPQFSGPITGEITNYFSWPKVVNGVQSTSTTYATTDNINDAISFIQGQGADPWFLWVAFNAPHTPYHKPPADLHSYDSLPGTQADINANPRDYYEAMVEALDTEIGRLMGVVDLSDTTVIFLGDNGTPGGVIQRPFPANHAKGSLYEGGVNTPLIIRGAAVANPGTVNSDVIHCADLYSTILELFGVAPASVIPSGFPTDSQSFLPLITGAANGFSRPATISETAAGSNPGRCAVEGNYKLISFDAGGEEMYDVSASLRETTNLLAGTLDADQLNAYNSLRAQLDALVNLPNIVSVSGGPSDNFDLSMSWFSGAAFTLFRSPDLSEASWAEVTDAELIDGGGQTVILRDPNPPADKAFYRATAP